MKLGDALLPLKEVAVRLEKLKERLNLRNTERDIIIRIGEYSFFFAEHQYGDLMVDDRTYFERGGEKLHKKITVLVFCNFCHHLGHPYLIPGKYENMEFI